MVWFGGGKGDIILQHIQCVGNEDNLLQCTYGNEAHNCFYHTAAGVSCGNFHSHAHTCTHTHTHAHTPAHTIMLKVGSDYAVRVLFFCQLHLALRVKCDY